MTARYPLVQVNGVISELPSGDSLVGSISTTQVRQYVKNSTGVTITAGSIVYVSGANGNNVLVSLAQANAESTSSKTLGWIESDILTGNSGYVITDGILTGLDTSAAINEGDPIWLSPTVAGGVIYGLANKPSAPNHLVYLGVVSRKQSNNGAVFVKVQNGYELEELHNVAISSVANNDIVTYESSTSLWKNKQLASGQVTTALGFTPYNATNPSGYTSNTGTVTSVTMTVPSFLSVSGSPITASGTLAVSLSGTALPVANGGTGTATPSLVAGTNVTITGTWPNQTIAASGGGGGGATVLQVLNHALTVINVALANGFLPVLNHSGTTINVGVS